MEHTRSRCFTRLSLLVLAVASGACTAVLGEKGPGDEGAGDKGAGETDGEKQNGADIAATDAELAAADPALFEIAKKYFPSNDPGGPSARFYRLSRRQLDVTASLILPGAQMESALVIFPPDPLIRNYEMANDLRFSPVNFIPFGQWVESAAASVRSGPQVAFDCSGLEDPQVCYEAEARAFVSRAFRAVPPADVIDRYVDFFLASVQEVGADEATANLVEVTLSSPYFSFREEVFTDEQEMLLAAEGLQHLTYTLADVPPESLGFDSTQAAQYFATAEAREETAKAILATPQARAKLLRFFIAWLEVKEADAFNIEVNVFPEFTPQLALAMVEETQSFLSAQLAAAAPTLKALTESTESFVSSALADIYGIEGGTGDVTVELDPKQRRGIFTHPSVIASHSGPTETRLVKRGAYFTRKVMCQELGEPPSDAIPTGPLPGDTERERIESVTEPPQCAGCHRYINPFGFMLESYDPLGRYRTEDEHGFPVDSLIHVDFLDEGPFVAETAVDALTEFTRSAMFRQCFVRQLFAFYSGRPKAPSDDPTLREMFFRFSQDDNQEILRALSILASSTNFNRRLEAK